MNNQKMDVQKLSFRVLSLRVSPDTEERVLAQAKQKGVTVSNWLRRYVLSALLKSKIRPATGAERMFTYIAIDETGDHVKIGHTNNVKKRIRKLRGATLLIAIKGDCESELQHRFSADRISPRREWFMFSDDIRAFVEKRICTK